MSPQLTTWNFQSFDGQPVANGTFTARLNTDAVTLTGQQVSAGRTVSFTLDGDGNVTTDLWANDLLVPSGTTYRCRVTTASGVFAWENHDVTITTSRALLTEDLHGVFLLEGSSTDYVLLEN